MRSLTPGARWKRRYSFLIVDVPASYQRNLFRDCHLTGTSPAFILSSGSLMEGIDPIFVPDSEFQGPVAQSTPPSISSARPSPYSTPPPTLPHVFSRSANASQALGRIEVPRPSRNSGFSASTSFRMASAVASGSPRSTFARCFRNCFRNSVYGFSHSILCPHELVSLLDQGYSLVATACTVLLGCRFPERLSPNSETRLLRKQEEVAEAR
jgi:hypothetical protein